MAAGASEQPASSSSTMLAVLPAHALTHFNATTRKLPFGHSNISCVISDQAMQLLANNQDVSQQRGLCCELARRSSRHEQSCRTSAGRVRPLLITGVGRTGTTFVTKLLRNAGLSFSHDDGAYCPCPGDNGAASWPHAFSEQPFGTGQGAQRRCLHVDTIGRHWSYSRRRRLKEAVLRQGPVTRFQHVWHLVRDPLATIYSRWGSGNIVPFGAIDACNLAQPPPVGGNHSEMNRTLHRALWHVVQWNLFVEATASRRVRIEEFTRPSRALVRSLCAAAGGLQSTCPSHGRFAKAAASLSNSTNSEHTSKRLARVTWARLAALDAPMTAMAQSMAVRYGYEVPENARVQRLFSSKTQCRFTGRNRRWRCWLQGLQQAA